MNNEDIVYHYCGIDAFLSIIKTSKLRMSDITKLNDKQEYFWIRDKILNGVETELAYKGEEYLNSWKRWINNDNLDYKDITVYGICFSECKDLISQWVCYAQGGYGVSIGFSKTILQNLNGLDCNLKFGKVIYNEEAQHNYIEDTTNKVVDEYNKKNNLVALKLDDNYCIEFPYYKNPSFKEEQEWRLVLRLGEDNNDVYIGNIPFSENKYRSVDDRIISFIEMDFSDLKQDIIKEVIIGPKSQLSEIDVMKLFSKYGYYDRKVEHNTSTPILIHTSISSYR